MRQRRHAHTLWAIDDGGSWLFPCPQFHRTDSGDIEFVRGLDRVLPPLLSRGLHPTAIAGFLESPQPRLVIDGHPGSVRQWLLRGEPVDAVLDLLELADRTT